MNLFHKMEIVAAFSKLLKKKKKKKKGTITSRPSRDHSSPKMSRGVIEPLKPGLNLQKEKKLLTRAAKQCRNRDRNGRRGASKL